VNLIGEHTDYNLGFVLPIALDMACFIAAGPGSDGMLRLYSTNMAETAEYAITDIGSLQKRGHWSDYAIGVAQQLHKLGIPLTPMDLAIHSTVPVGSGLSSSAALEISTALALLFGRELDRTELAQLARRAERDFVGVPVGIMDQYVSVFGEAHKAIRIDCRSLSYEAVPIPDQVSIVGVNSMVKHELGSSAYATRVRECAEAVEAIRTAYPGVESLRDVSSDMLDRCCASMPDNVFRRARHVCSENERVLAFTGAAADNDLLVMGRLFLASHRSMRDDYEISCEEIDFLVDTASSFSGVYGSRMTGGGFGGCTVNLVAPNRVEMFRQNITAAYQRHYGLTPEIFVCEPAAGAGELE